MLHGGKKEATKHGILRACLLPVTTAGVTATVDSSWGWGLTTEVGAHRRHVNTERSMRTSTSESKAHVSY